MIDTEAWVLHQGVEGELGPGALRRETYSFPDITEHETLVEPIYGCWEANMTHALERDPVDVCRLRGEERVVLGNAGVVRVLRRGAAVSSVREGELCCVAPVGQWDAHGYLLKVVGYDSPRSIGLLAKRLKLHERQLLALPTQTRFSYRQWAAWPVRYASAWANWKVAYGCWRVQTGGTVPPEETHVWGWGGGVALAELCLARLAGCRAAMIASSDERLRFIEKLGLQPVDRREFADLHHDSALYQSDREYRKRYVKAQKAFSASVRKHTDGALVSIFIDNVGAPVTPATLRALCNRGVITTAGWKKGMHILLARANECMGHRVHVHTHGCPLHEGPPAIQFSEEQGWIPSVADDVYGWDDIPKLAEDYAADRLSTYFPVFQVNPL